MFFGEGSVQKWKAYMDTYVLIDLTSSSTRRGASEGFTSLAWGHVTDSRDFSRMHARTGQSEHVHRTSPSCIRDICIYPTRPLLLYSTTSSSTTVLDL